MYLLLVCYFLMVSQNRRRSINNVEVPATANMQKQTVAGLNMNPHLRQKVASQEFAKRGARLVPRAMRGRSRIIYTRG